MKTKTAELTGPALDWAVAKCEIEIAPVESFLRNVVPHPDYNNYHPSSNWAHGGPIIERENISLLMAGWDEVDAALPIWEATSYSGREVVDGPTPLVAAMRCYVASKLGDEIEVPNELA